MKILEEGVRKVREGIAHQLPPEKASSAMAFAWFVWDADHHGPVESRCGAVAVGRTYLLPPLSSDGALVARP